MDDRLCKKCEVRKPITDFRLRDAKRPLHVCIECEKLDCKQRRNAAKQMGKCGRCYVAIVTPPNITCEACYDKQNKSSKDFRRNIKLKAIQYLGGKCQDCGLVTEWIAVYDFHHLDPKIKEFGIGTYQKSNSEDIQAELDKCVLLCSNCHRIRHAKMEAGICVDD